MKKLITNFLNALIDDRFMSVAIFFIDGEVVHVQDVFNVPLINDEVWIRDKPFKVERREILSTYGYEVRLHGKFI